jgi:hypothetical protein
MPRDGAIIFSDLIGKLDVLRVSCEKCGRDGCYGLSRLIDKRGRDAKVIDWLDELTADCPKKIAHNMNDPCGARCPQLSQRAIKTMRKHSFKKVGGVPKPPPPPPGIRTSR